MKALNLYRVAFAISSGTAFVLFWLLLVERIKTNTLLTLLHDGLLQ